MANRDSAGPGNGPAAKQKKQPKPSPTAKPPSKQRIPEIEDSRQIKSPDDLYKRLPSLEDQEQEEKRAERMARGPKLFRLRFWGYVLPFVMGAMTWQLYLPHVCPVLFSGDSGELITAAHTGGIAHPPAFPLYISLMQLWLGVGWTSPSPWQPEVFGAAYGGNLFSTFCAAVSVAIITLFCWNMSRHAVWAVMGGFFWLITPTFFSQSLIAEVYTFQALLVSLWLLCAYMLLEFPRPSWLAGCTLMQGFLLAHHPASVLFVPVTLFVLYLHSKEVQYPTQQPWITAIIAFGFGLLPYLSLPIRSMADPYLDWGNPETWENFWAVVTRATYREVKAGIETDSPIGFVGVVNQWAQWTWAQYGAIHLAGVIGIVLAIWKGGRWTWTLLAAVLFAVVPYWIYFQNIGPQDLNYLEVYFIPAHLLIMVLGIYGLMPKPGSRHPLTTWQAAILAVAALWLGWSHWSTHHEALARDKSVIGSRFAYHTFVTIPNESALIVEGDEIFLYWYLQGVAGVNPDVAVLEKATLFAANTWYWEDLVRRHPDLTPPRQLTAAEAQQKDLETTEAQLAYLTREMVRANPGRTFYIAGISFNPSNKTSIGIGSYGLLYEVNRGPDKAPSLEAFTEQQLFPVDLGWLKRQTSSGSYDFLEKILFDKYVRTLITHADVAFAAERFETADEMYELVLILDPSQTDILEGLGLSYMRLEKWASARDTFELLTEHDPNNPNFAYALAMSQVNLGNLEEARIEMARAKALDPDNQLLEFEFESLENLIDAANAPPTDEPAEEPAGSDEQ